MWTFCLARVLRWIWRLTVWTGVFGGLRRYGAEKVRAGGVAPQERRNERAGRERRNERAGRRLLWGAGRCGGVWGGFRILFRGRGMWWGTT